MPSFKALGPQAFNSNATSITVDWPTGHATGDLGILFVYGAHSSGDLALSGWNLCGAGRASSGTASTDNGVTCFWRIAASSSEPGVVWTHAGGAVYGRIVTFADADPVLPIEAYARQGGGSYASTLIVAGNTTSVDNVLYVLGFVDASATAGNVLSVDNSFSSILSIAAGGTNGLGPNIWSRPAAIAGNIGSTTIAFNANSNAGVQSIGIKPVGASPIASTGGFTAGGSSTLQGTAAAASAGAIAFALSAVLSGAAALLSAGSIAFNHSGTLTGSAPLAASMPSTFGGAANLSGIAPIGHAGAIVFGGTATGVTTQGPSSVGGIAFGGTASLVGTGALGHAGSIVIGGTAAAIGTHAASSMGPLAVFNGSAVLAGKGALAATIPAAFGGNLVITTAVAQNAGALVPRKALLLTIGAPPLPSVTPIIPVTVTGTVDAHIAPAVLPPQSMTLQVTVDGVDMFWDASPTVGDKDYIVQLAPDVAGAPGAWAIFGSTKNLHYRMPLPGAASWVRVYAALNGRNSVPTAAGYASPISHTVITGSASAVATLQQDVTTINGTLVAHATDLVSLDARADVLETSMAGVQTQTTALAAADAALDARVTANESSITAQSSQITSLRSSIDTSRIVSARGGVLTFRQAAAPTIGGTKRNLLDRTEEFTDAYWSKTCTVTAVALDDPLFSRNTDRATPSADGQRVHGTVTGLGRIGADLPATGRTFTWSIWLRADTAHDATLQLIAPTTGTTETLHVAVTTAWQRFSVSRTFTTETDTSLRAELYPKKLGVAGAPNNSVDMFGGQLEEGPLGPYQRVGATTDYDGNGIPVGSTWYDTDDVNRERRWDGGAWVLVEDTRIQATADATTALETRVTSSEGAITTQSNQITAINAELPGKAAVSAVQALDVRVSSTETGVSTFYAAYSLTLDVNGYVSGYKSVNNGSVAAFQILADSFSIVKPGGGARTEYSGGNWRVYDSLGTLRVRMGVW